MDLSQALATFLDESRELLAQMEEILLRAETAALPTDELHALFRCAHTIKGSAGLFGLDAVVHFTHAVESVLDRMRNGELELSDALINLLLESQDHIAGLVAAVAAERGLVDQRRRRPDEQPDRERDDDAGTHVGGEDEAGGVVAEEVAIRRDHRDEGRDHAE